MIFYLYCIVHTYHCCYCYYDHDYYDYDYSYYYNYYYNCYLLSYCYYDDDDYYCDLLLWFMIIIIIDVLSIILRFCIDSKPVLTFSEMPRIPADERSAPSSDRKEEADEGIRRPQPDETQADLMTMRSPNGNSVGGVFVSPRALEQSEISTMRPTITHPVRTEEASSSNNASPVPTATVESVEETPAMKANSLVDAHYEPDEEEKVRQ